ncbi:hypothetical protein AcW1_000577 [Taiwanofungus camphoratus]|nr:hypothetical protein AcW2_000930 [Antrodia cinnamomea]KAI0936303.1 hypothetical protein AcV5_004475 [Antrodia cinnamomea]KAI0961515.1 hypothetical protein AcV7_000595 [Antrodia cinnamomea]KAI0963529.1 hypothetical protein AcW1_000577 [Antrodia cinnamomea]
MISLVSSIPSQYLGGLLRDRLALANLVLEDTVERIYYQDLFAEAWRGLFLIRGENVVLLGEVDLDQEDEVPLRQVAWDDLEPYHKQEITAKKRREEIKASVLFERNGFCKEGGEGDGY